MAKYEVCRIVSGFIANFVGGYYVWFYDDPSVQIRGFWFCFIGSMTLILSKLEDREG